MNEQILSLIEEFLEKLANTSQGKVVQASITLSGNAGLVDISKPIERTSAPYQTMYQTGTINSSLKNSYTLIVPILGNYVPGKKNMRVSIYRKSDRLHLIEFESPDRAFDMVTEIVREYHHDPSGPFYLYMEDISTGKVKEIAKYMMSFIPAGTEDIIKTYNVGV